MDAAHHVDRRLGVLAALHVHAHKTPRRPRVLCHLANNALGQQRIQVHAHLRELHAHIRVQMALANRIQQLVIDGRRTKGFLGRVNVFS